MRRVLELTLFSGKKKDWQKWSAKFLAKARMKGYMGVLIGQEAVLVYDATRDTSTAKGKLNDCLSGRNNSGYNELILSMEFAVCLGVVQNAKTTDQIYGDLALAWNKLC